jgi:hypothetical protein
MMRAPGWAQEMAAAIVTRMDDARKAHGLTVCSCGVKLDLPSEVITGVCVFCMTPADRALADLHYGIADRAASITAATRQRPAAGADRPEGA